MAEKNSIRITEKIDKINTHYSMTTPASAFDEEALTALQLAGRVANKINEVIELVNSYDETILHGLESIRPIAAEELTKAYETGVFWSLMDSYYYKLKNQIDSLIISAGDGTIPSELANIRNTYRYELFPLAQLALNHSLRRLDENPLPDDMLYSLFDKTINLYNPRNVTFRLALDGNENVLSTNSPDCHTTDYIDLYPLPATITDNTAIWFKQSHDGVNIEFAQVRAVNFYDEEYRHITAPTGKYENVDYITVKNFPEFARYIRVTFAQSYAETGTNFGIGYSQNACLMRHYAPKMNTSASAEKWKGKNILIVGDSQVSQNKWQPYIANALGVNIYNFGSDGYPVTLPVASNIGFTFSSDDWYNRFNQWMYQNDIATRIISDGEGKSVAGYGGVIGNIIIDAVLILAGTNDGSYASVIKGEYNSNSSSHFDFSSRYTTFINNVYRNVQDAEIYVISPPNRMVEGTTTMGDINIAIRDVANYKGWKYINGFSAFTYDQKFMYLEDGIHFNSAGAEKFAEAVIKGLTN